MIGEIAARLSGGYMSGWTYPYASDVFLTKELMRLSVGLEPDFSEYKKTFPCYSIECKRTSSERAYISIPGQVKNIYGIEEAKKIKNVMKVLKGQRFQILQFFLPTMLKNAETLFQKMHHEKMPLMLRKKQFLLLQSVFVKIMKKQKNF